MDPLSGAASVIQVIQVSSYITAMCYEYYRNVKEGKKDAKLLQMETRAMLTVTERLVELLDGTDDVYDDDADSYADGEYVSLDTKAVQVRNNITVTEIAAGKSVIASLVADGVLQSCLDELNDVHKQLRKTLDAWSRRNTGQKSFKDTLRVLRWPLCKADLVRALEDIQRLRTIIQTGLAVDTARDVRTTLNETRATLNETRAVHRSITALKQDQQAREVAGAARDLRESILCRLAPPGLSVMDLAAKHADVSRHHDKNTSKWLLESPEFAAWLPSNASEETSVASLLWLHGIPGCGKTVLTSSVIECIQALESSNNVAAAYFYFDFSKPAFSCVHVLLRSLVAQLASSTASNSELPPFVKAFASRHLSSNSDSCSASPADLMAFLQDLVRHKTNDGQTTVLVMIDALDECTDQAVLLPLLVEMLDWEDTRRNSLRLFFASRYLVAIGAFVQCASVPYAILSATEDRVNADIETFLRNQMQNDVTFSPWPADLKHRVHDALASGARGMFLWVSCQIEYLRTCVRRRDVNRALSTLPDSLPVTYTRLLLSVPHMQLPHTVRLLWWLAVAPWPLNLLSADDVLAVDLDEEDDAGCYFHDDGRVMDTDHIFGICTTLVHPVKVSQPATKYPNYPRQGGGLPRTELRLVHNTVKEYLISRAFQTDFLAKVALYLPPSLATVTSVRTAHAHIAKTLLGYLLSLQVPLNDALLADRPLARTAAEHWLHHFSEAGGFADCDDPILCNMVMALFGLTKDRSQDNNEAFRNWQRLFDYDIDHLNPFLQKENFSSPLFLACRLGLDAVVKQLVGCCDSSDELGACLHIALQGRHVDVIAVLLDAGVDPDATERGYHNLEDAASDGSADVVALLLAAYETQKKTPSPERTSSALLSAMRYGHVDVVRLLLAWGVNLNGHPLWWGNKRARSLKRRDIDCIGLIIPSCTDSTLLASLEKLDEAEMPTALTIEVLHLMATRIPGPVFHFASRASCQPVVEAMMEPPQMSTATKFAAACKGGNVTQARELLSTGALDVRKPLWTTADGRQVFALFLAVWAKQPDIVEMCLSHGADAEMGDSKIGCPMSLAVHLQRLDLVELLVEHGGASCNNMRSVFGGPLQAAAYTGNCLLVEYLLATHSTDVHQTAAVTEPPFLYAYKWAYWTPMQIAVWRDNLDAVTVLLAYGADVNRIPLIRRPEDGQIEPFPCSCPCTPLSVAAKRPNSAMVHKLLDAGALFCNKIPAYLETGGDSTTSDLQQVPSNPLYWAINGGSAEVVQLLLAAGAEINGTYTTRRGFLTMLVAMCETIQSRGKWDPDMLRVLVKAGADVNAPCVVWDREVSPVTLLARRGSGKNIRDAVRSLVQDYGANINRVYGGKPVLHHVIENATFGDSDLFVTELLELGADPMCPTPEGDLPIHFAARMMFVSCLKLLREAKPDTIHARNAKGQTPLHVAAEYGSYNVMTYLLEQGADIGLQDINGHTPKMCALAALLKADQTRGVYRDYNMMGSRFQTMKLLEDAERSQGL